jgi:hypothetical protein
MGGVDLDTVLRAQDRLLAAVGQHPDVNGVGIARGDDGGYVLKVTLARGDARGDVPAEIDGVPVRAQTIGPVRKRPA